MSDYSRYTFLDTGAPPSPTTEQGIFPDNLPVGDSLVVPVGFQMIRCEEYEVCGDLEVCGTLCILGC